MGGAHGLRLARTLPLARVDERHHSLVLNLTAECNSGSGSVSVCDRVCHAACADHTAARPLASVCLVGFFSSKVC